MDEERQSEAENIINDPVADRQRHAVEQIRECALNMASDLQSMSMDELYAEYGDEVGRVGFNFDGLFRVLSEMVDEPIIGASAADNGEQETWENGTVDSAAKEQAITKKLLENFDEVRPLAFFQYSAVHSGTDRQRTAVDGVAQTALDMTGMLVQGDDDEHIRSQYGEKIGELGFDFDGLSRVLSDMVQIPIPHNYLFGTDEKWDDGILDSPTKLDIITRTLNDHYLEIGGENADKVFNHQEHIVGRASEEELAEKLKQQEERDNSRANALMPIACYIGSCDASKEQLEEFFNDVCLKLDLDYERTFDTIAAMVAEDPRKDSKWNEASAEYNSAEMRDARLNSLKKLYSDHLQDMVITTDVVRKKLNEVELSYDPIGYSFENREVRLLTDEDFKDIPAVTSPNFFTDSGEIDQDGPLSEKLAGPKHGASCSCGNLHSLDKKAYARGTICDECGTLVKTPEDRKIAKLKYESPVPYLVGREGLVASLLDTTVFNVKTISSYGGLFVMDVDSEGNETSKIALVGKVYETNIDGTPKLIEWTDNDKQTIKETQEDFSRRHIYVGNEGLSKVLARLTPAEALKNAEERRDRAYNDYVEAQDTPIREYLSQEEKDDLAEKKMANPKKRFMYRTDTDKNTQLKKAEERFQGAWGYLNDIEAFISNEQFKSFDQVMVHNVMLPSPGTLSENDMEAMGYIHDLIQAGNDIKRAQSVNVDDITVMKNLVSDYSNKLDAYQKWKASKGLGKEGMLKGDLWSKKGPIFRASIHAGYLEEEVDKFKKMGVDIPDSTFVLGVPRRMFREHFTPEIKNELRRNGFTEEQIIEAMKEPANRKIKVADKDGKIVEKPCAADQALDVVMANHGEGTLVSYFRNPVNTISGTQFAYAVPIDSDTFEVADLNLAGMNADCDGDTITAIVVDLTMDAIYNVMSYMNEGEPDEKHNFIQGDTIDMDKFKEVKERELKRLFSNGAISTASDSLQILPKNEHLTGLCSVAALPEDYMFKNDVYIEDPAKNEEKLGHIKDGITQSIANVYAHTVMADITNTVGKNGIPDYEDGAILPAKTPYAPGKSAFVRTMVKKIGDKTYLLDEYPQMIRLPRGVKFPQSGILEKGQKVWEPPKFTVTPKLVDKYRASGEIVYNQPIDFKYTDSEGKKQVIPTTAGRALFAMNIAEPGSEAFDKFGASFLRSDELVTSKYLNKLGLDYIEYINGNDGVGEYRGLEEGMFECKKMMSRLDRYSYKVGIPSFGRRITLADFPSNRPIDTGSIVNDVAHNVVRDFDDFYFNEMLGGMVNSVLDRKTYKFPYDSIVAVQDNGDAHVFHASPVAGDDNTASVGGDILRDVDIVGKDGTGNFKVFNGTHEVLHPAGDLDFKLEVDDSDLMGNEITMHQTSLYFVPAGIKIGRLVRTGRDAGMDSIESSDLDNNIENSYPAIFNKENTVIDYVNDVTHMPCVMVDNEYGSYSPYSDTTFGRLLMAKMLHANPSELNDLVRRSTKKILDEDFNQYDDKAIYKVEYDRDAIKKYITDKYNALNAQDKRALLEAMTYLPDVYTDSSRTNGEVKQHRADEYLKIRELLQERDEGKTISIDELPESMQEAINSKAVDIYSEEKKAEDKRLLSYMFDLKGSGFKYVVKSGAKGSAVYTGLGNMTPMLSLNGKGQSIAAAGSVARGMTGMSGKQSSLQAIITNNKTGDDKIGKVGAIKNTIDLLGSQMYLEKDSREKNERDMATKIRLNSKETIGTAQAVGRHVVGNMTIRYSEDKGERASARLITDLYDNDKLNKRMPFDEKDIAQRMDGRKFIAPIVYHRELPEGTIINDAQAKAIYADPKLVKKIIGSEEMAKRTNGKNMSVYKAIPNPEMLVGRTLEEPVKVRIECANRSEAKYDDLVAMFQDTSFHMSLKDMFSRDDIENSLSGSKLTRKTSYERSFTDNHELTSVDLKNSEPMGIKVYRKEERHTDADIAEWVNGMYLAADVVDPETSEMIARRGTELTTDLVKAIQDSHATEIQFYSPLSSCCRGTDELCLGAIPGFRAEIGQNVGLFINDELGSKLTQRILNVAKNQQVGANQKDIYTEFMSYIGGKGFEPRNQEERERMADMSTIERANEWAMGMWDVMGKSGDKHDTKPQLCMFLAKMLIKGRVGEDTKEYLRLDQLVSQGSSGHGGMFIRGTDSGPADLLVGAQSKGRDRSTGALKDNMSSIMHLTGMKYQNDRAEEKKVKVMDNGLFEVGKTDANGKESRTSAQTSRKKSFSLGK